MEIISPASYNWLSKGREGARWTAAENKLFENALAVFDKDTPERWHNVAAVIPGKTVGDVIRKYKELEFDVSNIEAGLVPIPGYTTTTAFTLDWPGGGRQAFCLGSKRPAEQERKKGVPWTEEEHKLFLMGLKKYGKGDWRNISRNLVVSRTPTQVASHAQKYFIRQVSGGGKEKRRASIHDITTVSLNDPSPPDPPNTASSPSVTPPFQWNNNQPGFHVGNGNMFASNPCGISSFGLKMQGHGGGGGGGGTSSNNSSSGSSSSSGGGLHRGAVRDSYFGPQSMVFQMQSTHHYPHG